MLNSLRQLFRQKDEQPRPAVAAGQRVYAVGDIHGRHDLFEKLLAAIEEDDARRGAAKTTIILLGDLVDRGPDSARVIATARALVDRGTARVLAGNHEEMFLKSFEDKDIFRHFLRYGGRETVLSYGIDRERYLAADMAEAQELMREAVPAEDRAFIAAFENSIVIGDYLFVHAGVRPGTPLDEQTVQDMRWIREPFLNHNGALGAVVVHGHTITDAPEIRANRIGIDTGAYKSGRLTALGLEGTERWIIDAVEAEQGISATSRAA